MKINLFQMMQKKYNLENLKNLIFKIFIYLHLFTLHLYTFIYVTYIKKKIYFIIILFFL